MKILTNRNSNNHYHDNVKYKPIEVQVGDILKEHYDKVEFEASAGNLKYTINGDFEILLFLKDRDFSLLCRQQTPSSMSVRASGTGDIKYNSNCESEIKKFIDDVTEMKEEEAKILEIIGEHITEKAIEKKKLAINKFLSKHFKSDLYEVDTYFHPANLMHRDPLFNYWCISLSPHQEIYGNNNGAVQIPIGFDGKIMSIHPFNGKDIFEDCIMRTFPERYNTIDEAFTINFMKKWIKNMERLEKELKSFNAMDCPEFKEILEVNEKCYNLIAKDQPIRSKYQILLRG